MSHIFDVCVNDFYPAPQVAPLGTGASRTLSDCGYMTLTAAQVDYPFADSLTLEIDYCAWMKALLVVYDAPNQTISGGNWSAGTVRASGRYVTNRTIRVNIVGCRIIGDAIGVTAVGRATSVQWIGDAGTRDEPVYIFDCYTHDEGSGTIVDGNYVAPVQATQPGSSTPSGALTGLRTRFDNITFFGQFGDITADSEGVSNYISGVRVRMGSFCEFEACNFGGTLWDGIVCTAQQQFLGVRRCRFDAIHRDAISIRQVRGDFTAATYIEENEFALVGRYAIYGEAWGSVEAAWRVINNDFEHAYRSFFVKRPDWWVHGVVAGMVFNNVGNLNYHDNRTEGVILTTGYNAEVHLIACQNPALRDSTTHKIMCTSHAGSGPRTAAAITYEKAHHYNDLTPERNYNCGSVEEFSGPNDSITVENLYNLLEIIQADACGITGGGRIKADMVEFQMPSYPTKAGTYARQVDFSATPTMLAMNSYSMAAGVSWLPAWASTITVPAAPTLHSYGASMGNGLGVRRGFDNNTEMELFGEFYIREGNSGVGYDNYRGLTLNRGVTDMSKPGNFLDSPWMFARVKDESGADLAYYEMDVVKKRKLRYDFTAVPTGSNDPMTGMPWNVGDIVYKKTPVAGGWMGWVLTADGWKEWGAIAP